MSPILEVCGLVTEFITSTGRLRAVDGVSFSLEAGTTLAIVGESGCGKSVTALSILRVLPEPGAEIVAGQVLLDGRDLLALSDEETRAVRGAEISMIFQEPMTSLNPVMTIGNQIVETIREHRPVSRSEARAQALELLERVRIPDAGRRLDDYPHRLSGGMRQRVMIAMALACRPKVLIADEPTTALDVTIQAQILSLLAGLQAQSGTAVILITHNLGVVAEAARRVLVMYAGRVVEEADVKRLFRRPLHPYTQGLLGATPRLDTGGDEPSRLTEIPGIVPPLDRLPAGCAFAPRCPRAVARCREAKPALEAVGDGRRVACFVAQAGRADP